MVLMYYFHRQIVLRLLPVQVWLPGWAEAINNNGNSLFLTIGPGDFLVHVIALGLHTTTLILVKGALDARGSKLCQIKRFGYSFLVMDQVVVVHVISQLGMLSTYQCSGC